MITFDNPKMLAATVQRIVALQKKTPEFTTLTLSAAGGVATLTGLRGGPREEPVQICAHIPCGGEDSAPIGLPSAALLAAVKGHARPVGIDPISGTVTHSTGNTKLQVIPAETIPGFPAAQGVSVSIEMPAGIGDSIYSACQMAAVSDTRFYLVGVHLITRGGRLVAEASDGHRATMIDVGPCNGDVSVIIPYHAALAMKGAEGVLTITTETETRVDVSLGDVTARAIDGRYPDMLRIIPSDAAHLVTLPAKELAAVIKRLRPHSNKKYHGLIFNFSSDSIKVETCNEELQCSSETLTANCSFGATIGLNADYLLDALKGLTTARVLVSAKRPHDSTVQIIDGATVNFVMPMHL